MSQTNKMEFMLDTETLSTKRGGIILEVACIAFLNGVGVDAYVRQFSRKESLLDGFLPQSSTVEWWAKRGGVPEDMDGPDGNQVVMLGLRTFITHYRNGGPGARTNFWSKGAMDFEMLEAYFERYLGEPSIPWRYDERRELRTALEELGAPVSWEGVDHRAYADAKEQVERLTAARSKMMLEGFKDYLLTKHRYQGLCEMEDTDSPEDRLTLDNECPACQKIHEITGWPFTPYTL